MDNGYFKLVYLFIVLVVITGLSGSAMTWHDGAYDASTWSAGFAPLGFDDASVTTEIASGRPSYYFRNLFFMPSTSDPEMTELKITVHSGQGVIVTFHSHEAGRSSWLPSGDLPYDYTGVPSETVETQEFDLTDILNQCENGMGSTFRAVTVEVHQADLSDSLSFDAVMEAKISGSWEPVIELNDQWLWWQEPTLPPSTADPTLNMIYAPLAGLPELVSPGERIRVVVDASLNVSRSVFMVTSPECSRIITNPQMGTPDEKGQTVLLDLPADLLPGTYSLQIIVPDDSGLPGAPVQTVWETRSSVGVLPAEETSITMIHVSDSHVPFRGYYNSNNTADLQRVWDELPGLQPDFVVHTGDGYNEGNYRDQAECFRNMLDHCYSPVVYVSGNHELGEWCGDGSSRDHYWDFFGWPRLDPRRADHLLSMTRDFVIDVGDLSLVGIETWVSYTDYWETWYSSRSVTYNQAQWMVNVANQRPDQTLVACYHHDFDGALEPEVLSPLGYDYGLSGHTHSEDEYPFGPTTCLKVPATYGSNKPMRRLQFEDGVLVSNELLRFSSMEISADPPFDQPATTRSIRILSKHNGVLPGHKLKIPMIPGLEYSVTGDADTVILGQWEGKDRTWVWLSNDLEAFEELILTVAPAQPEPPCCYVVFDIENPVFLAGEANAINGLLVNVCQANMVQSYIAMEVAGRFYFWPDWSETPTAQRVFLNRDQVYPVSVLSLTWPSELALFGETVTFWGAIVDDGSGDLISPITQADMIY